MRRHDGLSHDQERISDLILRRCRQASPFMYNKSEEKGMHGESKISIGKCTSFARDHELGPQFAGTNITKLIRPITLDTLKYLPSSSANLLQNGSRNVCKTPTNSFSGSQEGLQGHTISNQNHEGRGRVRPLSDRKKDAARKCDHLPFSQNQVNILTNDLGFLYRASSINSGTVLEKRTLHSPSTLKSGGKLDYHSESQIRPIKTDLFQYHSKLLQRPKLIPRVDGVSRKTVIAAVDSSDRTHNSGLHHTKLSSFEVHGNPKSSWDANSKVEWNTKSAINSIATDACAGEAKVLRQLQRSRSALIRDEIYKEIKKELVIHKEEIIQNKIYPQTSTKQILESLHEIDKKKPQTILGLKCEDKPYYAVSVRRSPAYAPLFVRSAGISKCCDFTNLIPRAIQPLSTITNFSGSFVEIGTSMTPEVCSFPNEGTNALVEQYATLKSESKNLDQNQKLIRQTNVTVCEPAPKLEIDSGNGTDEEDQPNQLGSQLGQLNDTTEAELDQSDADELIDDDSDDDDQGSLSTVEDEDQSNEEDANSPIHSNCSISSNHELSSPDLQDDISRPMKQDVLETFTENQTTEDKVENKSENDFDQIRKMITQSSTLANSKVGSIAFGQADHPILTRPYSRLSVSIYDPKFKIDSVKCTDDLVENSKDNFNEEGKLLSSVQSVKPERPHSSFSKVQLATVSPSIERTHSVQIAKAHFQSIRDFPTTDLQNKTNLDDLNKFDKSKDLDPSLTNSTVAKEQRPTRSKRSSVSKNDQTGRKTHPALIESLFPNIPPVLRFVEDGKKLESLPWEFRKLLKWRASMLTPIVVRQALMRSGFRVSKLTTASEDLETIESSDWIFYFGKHMRPQIFRSIREYQKVNHLPCSFQLGRKDRLWKNIVHMQTRWGKEHFNFIPQTFCLPGDLDLLKKVWDEEGPNQRWILKPPASARGIGVRLVTKWSQVPKKRPMIIQKYLSRPFLINESKFDLRIYVYISSINPLRLYIHEDGLVRFASQKYTNAVKSLGNRFVHLTNYSVNRLNSEYVSNTNELATKGHKWSLKALWTYFKSQGISPAPIWSSIKDVVVKTAISTEALFNTALNTYCNYACSVHEVFGFDIFLDEDLQPWLLEVNVSPSMHSDSLLDAKVKGSMVKDMLNIAGLRLPEDCDVSNPVTISNYLNRLPKQSSDTPTSLNSPSWNLDAKGVCVAPNPLAQTPEQKQTPVESTQSEHNIKSSGDQGSLNQKPWHQVNAKPKRPSHEWLIDSRLHVQLLSRDEKEKQRYFRIKAMHNDLPKPFQTVTLANQQSQPTVVSSSRSTPQSRQNCHNSRSSNHSQHTSPTSKESSDSGMSSTSSSESENSESEDVQQASNFERKSARSMGIGPSSPDLKSHRTLHSKETLRSNLRAKTCDRIKQAPPTVVQNPSPSPQQTTRSKSSCHSSRPHSPARTLTNNLPRVRLTNATEDILECLTPYDARILTSMVDELERAGGFECIFPPTSAGLAVRYLSYFEEPRYANLLCIAYLLKYGQEKEKGIQMLQKICSNKVHLLSGAHGDHVSPDHTWSTYMRRKTKNVSDTNQSLTNQKKKSCLASKPPSRPS